MKTFEGAYMKSLDACFARRPLRFYLFTNSHDTPKKTPIKTSTNGDDPSHHISTTTFANYYNYNAKLEIGSVSLEKS